MHLPLLTSTSPLPEAEGLGHDSLRSQKPCPAGRAGFTPAAWQGAEKLRSPSSHPPGKSAHEFWTTANALRAKKAQPARLIFQQHFSTVAGPGWLSWPAKTNMFPASSNGFNRGTLFQMEAANQGSYSSQPWINGTSHLSGHGFVFFQTYCPLV